MVIKGIQRFYIKVPKIEKSNLSKTKKLFKMIINLPKITFQNSQVEKNYFLAVFSLALYQFTVS